MNTTLKPALSLDDLATAWLPRRITQLAAMPGLCNDLGSIQIESDIAAFKHPVFPPYSAGDETTAITVLDGKNLAQLVKNVEVRWRAFQVDRRCEAKGWKLESRTTVLADHPGVVVEVKITNQRAAARKLSFGLVLSGRAQNTGGEGYFWAVPNVPTTVFDFLREDGLHQTVSEVDIPDARLFTNDAGNAHSVQCVWPSPNHWRENRVPTWERTVAAGETVTVSLLCSYHEKKEEAVAIAKQWHGRTEEAFARARARWEALWNAAFTPGNNLFSGHLPILQSPHDAMNRLYYNGVLTILTCRRVYPTSLTKPCYLTLWPRRGEGSVYPAWELPYTSGILARLDPAALRAQWLLMLSAPELHYQQTNYFQSKHGGWACCTHFQAIYTTAFNLMRWTGDTSWKSESVTRKERTLTVEEALREAILAHRRHHLPNKKTIDYGPRKAYLECITNYAHGTAGHTALQARALNEGSGWLGENTEHEQRDLIKAVIDLYRQREGFFSCEYPDGKRVPAPNLYDLGLTLNAVGEHLPRTMVKEIVRFARKHLLTPTWAHCLWPGDLDVTSGIRADHQWAGCFPAWPPQFIMGLLRSGVNEPWMIEWLEGIAKVTAQGPFSQAYWAEDVRPPEAGAAAKCYDEMTQANHWVIGSGVYLAEMILDGVCGLTADFEGRVSLQTGLQPWQNSAVLENIRCAGRSWTLSAGRLVDSHRQQDV